MRVTTMTQAKILMGTGTVLAILGVLIYFLTNFNSNGMLLTFGAVLLYEAVVRSEPGQQIFLNRSTFLPKNKFFQWIFAFSIVFLTVNSVLEIWKFMFAG